MRTCVHALLTSHRTMRILIGHNQYQQPGGEDAVARAEADLLKQNGEEVVVYERSNREIDSFSLPKKMSYAWQLNWSKRTYEELRDLLKRFKPDVVHFHNTFFMMTPSVFYACKDEGVAVVQSLHNFRMFCANGLFYRNNTVCEDCVRKSPWEGIRHRCYRGSSLLTACVARMIKDHRDRGTWGKKVDLFITATEFTKQKYVQHGIPAARIKVKPNFVYEDPGKNTQPGTHALYVGRLSPEKGVEVLIKAWEQLTQIPLKIIGAGELMGVLKESARNLSHVEFVGYAPPAEYDKYMRQAAVVIVPSVCYENFPRIVAEAYAYGIPVVASRLGSLPELVREGKTGTLFEAGNTSDLAGKVKILFGQENVLPAMRQQAREEYESKYAAQKNYQGLKDVYLQAVNFNEQVKASLP